MPDIGMLIITQVEALFNSGGHPEINHPRSAPTSQDINNFEALAFPEDSGWPVGILISRMALNQIRHANTLYLKNWAGLPR